MCVMIRSCMIRILHMCKFRSNSCEIEAPSDFYHHLLGAHLTLHDTLKASSTERFVSVGKPPDVAQQYSSSDAHQVDLYTSQKYEFEYQAQRKDGHYIHSSFEHICYSI